MKLNKPVIIFLVALFTVLAVVVALPQILSSESAYDNYIQEAREYNKKNLREKAMLAFDNALNEEDSLALRIEMADTYQKGLENGEFSSFYTLSDFLYDMVDAYNKEPQAYDTAAQYFYNYGKVEDCVAILYQAEDRGITSGTMDKLRNEVRYLCNASYSTYEEVVMTHENTYLIKNEKYSIHNARLGTMTGAKYVFATPMLNGFALVKTDQYAFLISQEGVREAYFPLEMTDSTGVGDGLIAVKVGETYKYYDLTGKVKFGEYDYAGRFANGVAPVKKGDKWFLVDKTGKQITNKTFEDIKLSQTKDCAQSGKIFAKSNGKYYLYDCSLNKIGSLSFDDADPFIRSSEAAAVKMGDKWGYINAKGEITIKAQYESAKSFSCSLAAVKDGEYWSFINTKNEKAITGEFREASYFNAEGYGFVKNDSFWYYLTRYYNR